MHAEEPNPSNLDSLMAMLAHKDGLIRKNAREALEEMGAPAVLPLYLDKPEGVAVDAALAAMEALIDRVNRRIADLTTTHREGAK